MFIFLSILLCCSAHKFDSLCSIAHVYQNLKYTVDYYTYAYDYDYKGYS